MITSEALAAGPQHSSQLRARRRADRKAQRPGPLVIGLAISFCSLLHLGAQPQPLVPTRGIAHAAALASAYDAILDAAFEDVPSRLGTACDTDAAWCRVIDAVALWWEIALEPEAQGHDRDFIKRVDTAIAAGEAWTDSEPLRAEAWLARGAALGVRAQFRVLRRERLAAARDGKEIRNTLGRALDLDPSLDDARFGIGMYRYYADVAPAALRLLRWLLLLPGGDRNVGLREMEAASERGVVMRGEADYQLHLIYLWYENRAHDALARIRGLQARHPRNPLFVLREAEIHSVYFHDANTSEVVLRALIARAEAGAINAAPLAQRRAHAALRALRTRSPR